jgi:hypothetical protein
MPSDGVTYQYTAGEVEIITRLTRLETEVHMLREAAEVYVRREEFYPVRLIAYGAVGVIVLAVFSALVALVVIK